MKAVRIALIFCAVAAFGQFPGGPFPGGGPYPGGGPPRTNPNPGGRRQPQQQPQDSRGRSNSRAPVTTTTEGMLRRASTNQLVIQADDHRVIWYAVNSRITVQKDAKDAVLSSFTPGDRVTVDSSEDDNGNYTAVAVQWLKAGTAEDRAAAVQTWDLPGFVGTAPSSDRASDRASDRSPSGRAATRDDDERPVLRRKNDDSVSATQTNAPEEPTLARAQAPQATPPAADDDRIDTDTRAATTVRPADAPADADDPGRPQLRRGGPATRRTAPPIPQSTNDSTPGVPQVVNRSPGTPPATRTLETPNPILPQEDPLIEKAREVAFNFIQSLPNFFCQQMTTRYQSENPKTGWNAIDIVSADVAYEEGRESYKNIKVGGKPVNKPMEEIGGTRSTGEFATELVSLLSPQTGATFRRSGQDTIRGRATYIYKFEVPRERSPWRIEAPSQLYYPAYRGSVWIDKDTGRVLRIEQEARNIPILFPFDTVETSTDYDYVRLAATEQFVLPVEAEALNCQRGSSLCARNKIEFRNYRKFGAQSSITFGDANSQQ